MSARLLTGMLVRGERALRYSPLPQYELIIGKIKKNPMPVVVGVLAVLVTFLSFLVMFLLSRL